MSNSNRKIFVVIRYSILSKTKAWKISDTKDREKYKQILFSEARMDTKFLFFKELVLPSLAQNESRVKNAEVVVLLYTSTQLPDKQRNKLKELCSPYNFMNIRYITEDDNFHECVRRDLHASLSQATGNSVYATVRLDDDDALGKDFLLNVEKYVSNEFSERIITFPCGFESLYEPREKTILKTIEIDYPKVAVGLTKIHKFDNEKTGASATFSIYDAGNHTKVDKSHVVVQERGTRPYYLKLAYAEQDTAEKGFVRRSENAPIVEYERLVAEFPVISGLLS
ncbi:glycosyltransferase [Alteromonas sp. RKMC-009]|uniref:glycosyltransferase n=1 Tax=Alteromonas sp. RKMC-009 TaxID=2267264 RepID=UPI000E69D3A0|nr:glycosyltransferase [Alteromonas sp. RKMC-009]AYA63003.1 hypothetical protein DS731_02700 [Alteromonas sp. RKMC-009]